MSGSGTVLTQDLTACSDSSAEGETKPARAGGVRSPECTTSCPVRSCSSLKK